MPDRVKALFPHYDAEIYAAKVDAMRLELKRIGERIRGAQECRLAFNELVRPREHTFRFGEVRTAMMEEPEQFVEELFRRYVRMESTGPKAVARMG